MLKPILLVEDNPKDLELTLIALERSQLANEVIVLRDGAEAIDFLLCRGAYEQRAEGNPAVIMLDLKLPKVDGLEVLKFIRQTPETRSTPVVMLTSSSEEPDLVRAYELGVNAYVVKPVEFGDFVAAISELGIFWAVLNEPPPGSTRFKVLGQSKGLRPRDAVPRRRPTSPGAADGPGGQRPDDGPGAPRDSGAEPR